MPILTYPSMAFHVSMVNISHWTCGYLSRSGMWTFGGLLTGPFHWNLLFGHWFGLNTQSTNWLLGQRCQAEADKRFTAECLESLSFAMELLQSFPLRCNDLSPTDRQDCLTPFPLIDWTIYFLLCAHTCSWSKLVHTLLLAIAWCHINGLLVPLCL